MLGERVLFVLWAANLGGVQSSILTRIRGLRRLGVKAEVLLLHSGEGRETFKGVTTYVTNNPRTFAFLVKRRGYAAVSFINVTPFVRPLRSIDYRGKLLYELRGLSERGLSVSVSMSANDIGAIVVPSQYVAGLVAEARADTDIPVHVVYNAVDTDLFRPMPLSGGRPASDRPDRPILLWVGRLDWNKNFFELLRIVLALRARGLTFTTWVVSDTKVSKYVHRFEQALRLTKLDRHVRLLANVPRRAMPRLYRLTADSGGCVLSTSKSEGLQNSLLEGMACGCPVVTSAVGGNVEIVADECCGATYPLGLPEVAAEKITRIFGDAQMRHEYATASLRRIKNKFSPDGHARSFLHMLKTVAHMEPKKLGELAPESPNGTGERRPRARSQHKSRNKTGNKTGNKSSKKPGAEPNTKTGSKSSHKRSKRSSIKLFRRMRRRREMRRRRSA